jgi:hypothetical protein
VAACRTHPAIKALEACAGCRESFCDACLVEFLGLRYCGPCRNAALVELQTPEPGPERTPFREFTVGVVAWAAITGVFVMRLQLPARWLVPTYGLVFAIPLAGYLVIYLLLRLVE